MSEIVCNSKCGDIADRIRAECAEIEVAMESSFGRMVTIGKLLAEAKGQLGHGEWIPWLADNKFPFTRQHAANFMRAANRAPEFGNGKRVLHLTQREILQMLAAPKDGPHISHNTGEFEWYTPESYVKAAADVTGGIDLDPASSDTANTVVNAAKFYDREADSLTKGWHGRVFMNPPYAAKLIGRFADKLIAELENGHVTEAIVLLNNATETGWGQTLFGQAAALVFPAGRVKFWQPDESRGSTPLQGQMVLYFGDNPHRFCARFGTFGHAFVPAKAGAA